MEDAKSVWNSKQDVFKILQPFWTSGCRRSYCFVQRKGHFPTIHSQETQNFDIKIYKMGHETVYTYDMTVSSLLIDTNNTQVPTQTWLRPVTTCVCKPEAENAVKAPDDERCAVSKPVESSMKGGIINSITRLHLVGYFYWVILRCTDP